MRELATIAAHTGAPLGALQWWDETAGILDEGDISAGVNVLARHNTPPGYVGVLLWWLQYWWDANYEAGFLMRWAAEDASWRLEQAGESVRHLAAVQEIRNPWHNNAGLPAPCWYPTPDSAKGDSTELQLNVGALAGEYWVGGRILGVDVPVQYWRREPPPDLFSMAGPARGLAAKG